MKSALIIGHTGQDGSYLFRHLEGLGYDVKGINRSSNCDITDAGDVEALIQSEKPKEVYFLAAVHQSSAEAHQEEAALFRQSIAVNFNAPVNFLTAIQKHCPATRFFYAASSHVFGDPENSPQDESTVLQPVCIYGITKTAGLNAVRFYRNTHQLFAAAGILYNHESPVRASHFVSQKIVKTAIAISKGKTDQLVLGSLSAPTDWGFAGDYVKAMHTILQQEAPDDFIISSGSRHTILDFVKVAFDHLHLDWKQYVSEGPSLITKRPKLNLFGNNRKLRQLTGWQPEFNFEDMVRHLVDSAL